MQCALLYFSLRDLANSSKLRRICRCRSRGGVFGVGEKLRPFVSICMSCFVSWKVLRLCIVMSGSWCPCAFLKNAVGLEGGMVRVEWWGVFVLVFCLGFFVGVGGVFFVSLCFFGVEGLYGVVGLVLLEYLSGGGVRWLEFRGCVVGV